MPAKTALLCGRVRQFRNVNRYLIRGIILLLGCFTISARATFSSIYIFGDSVSATATNAPGSTAGSYYGERYINGRSWVEVLAQRQGLGASSVTSTNWDYSSNNISFYGDYSTIMVTNVEKFIPPSNATNCLFVLWVCNADFVGDINDPNVGYPYNAYHGTNLAEWTSAINKHLTNHFVAITNLYSKGCRTLIAPNAADVTKIPYNNGAPAAYQNFVRQRIISFNTNYVTMLKGIEASSPGLKIYVPDVFSLLDEALTNAASFGLTNALYNGLSVDALEDPALKDKSLNGPGANYIFWDPLGNPTAKFQELIADEAQQMLSPVSIGGVVRRGGTNQLNLVNVPVGLTGSVLTCTNLVLANWTTNATFIGTNTSQSVFVTATNQMQFYRLKFPFQWTWP